MVKSEEGRRVSSLFFRSAVGAVVGMVVTLIMLYACSVLVAAGKIQSSLGESLIIASGFIGVIFGSLAALGKMERGVLTCALICGSGWFLLIIAFSAFGEGAIFDVLKLKLGICALGGSAFASALHVNKIGAASRRRNKRLYKK